jgi:hypothetical protein
MTRRFESKESALGMGLFYAGSKQKISDLKVKSIEKIKHPLAPKKEPGRDLEIYEVDGEKGKVEIGVEQQDNEFYLWLIDPDSALSIRA